MAILAFTQPDGQEAFIEFDATIREVHSDSVRITEHTVESGSFIVDHIRPNPNQIQIETVVSDTPIRPIANLADSVTGVVQSNQLTLPDGTEIQVESLSFDGTLRRSKNVYDELIRLMDNGITVRVSTRTRDYESMAIESVTVTDTAASGSSIPISIALKQIKVVATLESDLPEPAQARGQRRRRPTDNATTEVEEPTDPEPLAPEEQSSSILSGVSDRVEGFIETLGGGL